MAKTINRLLIIFLFCYFNQSNAQNEDCNCKTDLIHLNSKIKKTPSYKLNKEDYSVLYKKSLEQAETQTSTYDCFVLLNKLLVSLNDNHCKIFGIDQAAVAEVLNNPEKLQAFKNSSAFKIFPRPSLNLDSLKSALSAMPNEDIQGVYSRKGYMSIGVYKDIKLDDYRAIVLKSESNIWEKGEVIYTLVPYGNNYILAIGGGITSKRLIAYPERIEQGFFLTMGFQKDISKTNYSQAPYPDSTYVRKEISLDITYLKVGSFNSWYPTLADAEKFYKSLEGTLTKKNVIIDLRDNGGGGNRNSDGLLEIIEDYITNNNVYILTNNRTASNAEQFTFKLKKYANLKTFGQRTSGTVAYELKDGNFVLPCGNYIAVLTSKKHSEFLEIESVGIEPDVELDINSDWLDQVITIIKEKN